MKWHERFVVYPTIAQRCGISLDQSPLEITEAIIARSKQIASSNPEVGKSDLVVMLTSCIHEAAWVQDKRPYYNVWPSVIEPFSKLDLSRVDSSYIRFPVFPLLIRFPVGHELAGCVKSILISQVAYKGNTPISGNRGDSPQPVEINGIATTAAVIDSGPAELGGDRTDTYSLMIDCGRTFAEVNLPQVCISTIRRIPGTTIGTLIEGANNNAPELPELLDSTIVCHKLVAALALLQGDPDLIEPSPIEADRAKWERTHDPKLIEKAVRRGKYGFDVGKQVTVKPGFRSPHFAIRWMGHGQPKTPVLRPIKGCLVRYKELAEMPTGYFDKPEGDHVQ